MCTQWRSVACLLLSLDTTEEEKKKKTKIKQRNLFRLNDEVENKLNYLFVKESRPQEIIRKCNQMKTTKPGR